MALGNSCRNVVFLLEVYRMCYSSLLLNMLTYNPYTMYYDPRVSAFSSVLGMEASRKLSWYFFGHRVCALGMWGFKFHLHTPSQRVFGDLSIKHERSNYS